MIRLTAPARLLQPIAVALGRWAVPAGVVDGVPYAAIEVDTSGGEVEADLGPARVCVSGGGVALRGSRWLVAAAAAASGRLPHVVGDTWELAVPLREGRAKLELAGFGTFAAELVP